MQEIFEAQIVFTEATFMQEGVIFSVSSAVVKLHKVIVEKIIAFKFFLIPKIHF